MDSLQIARSLLEESKKDLDEIKTIHDYISNKAKELKKYRLSLNERIKKLQGLYFTKK